jgi:hypothetical protein
MVRVMTDLLLAGRHRRFLSDHLIRQVPRDGHATEDVPEVLGGLVGVALNDVESTDLTGLRMRSQHVMSCPSAA